MDSKKYSILVVDDDPPILELLGEYLSTRGHDCELASNTAQGLDLLGRVDFDVMITDLKMPGGGGLALLRNIRERNLSVAIVMMTGYGTIESALEAMKHGAHDYLLKPFRLRNVYDSMEQAIAKQQLERNTISLKHIVEFQKAADNTRQTEQLDALYRQLVRNATDELNGTGAAIVFFERNRGVWQEYCRTLEAPLGRVDFQSIGQALSEEHELNDKESWFSDPKPLIVSPISAATDDNRKRSVVGFIAVTGVSTRQKNPQEVINVYGSILGSTISLCLANSKLDSDTRSTPQGAIDRAFYSPLISGVINEMGLNDDDNAVAKYALNFSRTPHSTLRERYNGAPMDVMTIGGGGLPFKILSRLEPLLLNTLERYDGQGSPSGLVGDEIDETAQVVHIVSIFWALTSGRTFAHNMGASEAFEEIKSSYAGTVAPKVLSALSTALERLTKTES